MTQEDSTRRKQVLIKEHRAIVRAIALRDGSTAATKMEQHLRGARRRAIDGYEPGT